MKYNKYVYIYLRACFLHAPPVNLEENVMPLIIKTEVLFLYINIIYFFIILSMCFTLHLLSILYNNISNNISAHPYVISKNLYIILSIRYFMTLTKCIRVIQNKTIISYHVFPCRRMDEI